jgi:hypothetical protein
MTRLPSRICILVLLAVGCIDAQPLMAQYQPIEGQPHADFLLPRIDNGEPMSLASFRGKKVLLIHFASW